jgi:hypothetical protein
MSKIVVISYGIIHYHAMCQDCMWEDSDHIDRSGLRNRVRKHVKETGHTVAIESGNATHYTLEK